jgi:hypothetical protein
MGGEPRTPGTRRVVGTVAPVARLRRRALATAAGCEEWNVESCLPATLAIETVGRNGVTVTLRSGDAALRKRDVEVALWRAGSVLATATAEIGRDGSAVAAFAAATVSQADAVVATHLGDRAYCEAEARRDL